MPYSWATFICIARNLFPGYQRGDQELHQHAYCVRFYRDEPDRGVGTVGQAGELRCYVRNPAGSTNSKTSLYANRDEVDPDVKNQFLQDEVNRLRKQVSFLKSSQSCQECGSSAHSTSACTNIEQVRTAETIAEMNYMRGPYRNQPNYNDRSNNYQPWGNQNTSQNYARPPPDRRPAPY